MTKEMTSSPNTYKLDNWTKSIDMSRYAKSRIKIVRDRLYKLSNKDNG